MPETLAANTPFPTLVLNRVGGGTITVGAAKDNWTLFVVYRGKHCGRCKNYLNKLEELKSSWEEAGFDVVVVSADAEAKAQADLDEFGWSFDTCHSLSLLQMRALGVFVSTPLSPDEADAPFAEPGVFCITPEGKTQIVAISNGPAARPDLAELLDGMIFTIKNDRPARGDVSL